MTNNSELPAYFQGLNPEQLEAARHGDGPMLVLAGAGSGKTRVLTVRIAHLIDRHGVPPHRIFATTFTNKAAGEMRERVSHLLGAEPKGMWIGTFHAFGSRMLRKHAEKLGYKPRFTIYDSDDVKREVKRSMQSLDIDPERFAPESIVSAISSAKNALVSAEDLLAQSDFSNNPWEQMAARVYMQYRDSMHRSNAVDFDDLLMLPIQLLRHHPTVRQEYQDRFQHLLVDEYQDTNHAQYSIVKVLAEKHHNLFVVGDDDQAIYTWRGADIRNIQSFQRDYPDTRTVRLEQNYRSTPVILGAANEVIANNAQRLGKTLRTDRLGGETIPVVGCERDLDEARYVSEEIDRLRDESRELDYRDFSILYRTNAQARVMEQELRSRSIPYKVVGATSFFGRREIRDMLSYLRLVANPQDSAAFERVVNTPKRGIGKKSLDVLRLWAGEKKLPMLEAAAHAEMIKGIPKAGAAALVDFARVMNRFADRVPSDTAGSILQDLVKEIGLTAALLAEGPEGEDRASNVQELISGAHEFDQRQRDAGIEAGLDMYVEELALMSDPDTIDTDGNVVSLMTVHASKGLEFPVVFLTGVEEGLFPSVRALDDPNGIEEERRLLYVAITRARQYLCITHARTRRRGSDISDAPPSSFLQELPDECIEHKHASGHSYGASARYGGGSGGWSGRNWVDGGGRSRTPANVQIEDESLDFGDYDEFDQDVPSFVRNEPVEHPDLGAGIIAQVSGYGRDLYVTVEFENGSAERMLARRSGLRRGF